MRSTDGTMKVSDAPEVIAYRTSPAAAREEGALASCRLIAEFPPEAQRLFTEAARVRRHPRRALICRLGERLAGLSCIVRGLVRCWLVDVDGNDYTVETAWSASISMVSGGGPEAEWPWNVTTVVPTTMMVIPWDALNSIRRRYSVDEVLMAYAARDYQRRHVWHGLLRSVRLRPRLLLILRRMGDEFGQQTKQGVVLDFPVTQSDLASLASVTRDEVGRVVREFRADGLLKPIGRRGLLIPDLEALGPPPELP